MSPYLIGGIGVALWLTPAAIVVALIARAVLSRPHRPDPLFEDEEVAYLEEIWSMPARDHAS